MYSCTFTSCGTSSNDGGAIYITNSGSTAKGDSEIFNCTFNKCQSKNGGAIYIKTGQYSRYYNISICTFNENRAYSSGTSGGEGGAIYFEASYCNIYGYTFINNVGSEGGSITYNDNGQSAHTNRKCMIEYNRFKHNDESSAGYSLISVYVEQYSVFCFNHNEITSLEKYCSKLAIFSTRSSTKQGIWKFTSNCYSPSNCALSTSEILKQIIPSDHFTK